MQSGTKLSQAGGPSPLQSGTEFYVPVISHLTVFASRGRKYFSPVLAAGAQAEHWLTHGLFQSDIPNGRCRLVIDLSV